MTISLRVRVGLAALSGAACVLIYVFELPDDNLAGWLFNYGLPGLLFAAGVLFPYLRPGSGRITRGIALVLASTASFWCAVYLTLDGPGAATPPWFTFTTGSIAGAAIVMTAVAGIVPIRISLAYAVLGLLASVAGGPITSATLPTDDFVLIALGHAAWHVLICLAIYFGTPSTVAGAALSAALSTGPDRTPDEHHARGRSL